MDMQRNALWHEKVKHQSDQPPEQDPCKKMPSLWTRGFISVWAVSLIVFTASNMLISTFPLYLVELGGNEVLVGVAAALYSVMALMMRPLTGWMLDNRSRKTIFYIGLAGITLIPPLYALLPLLLPVIILRSLHGFLWAAAGTSTNTIGCDTVPASRFGEGVGYLGLTNSLAMVIGPSLGLIIWNAFGDWPLFLSISLFNLLALFMLRFVSFKNIERKTFAGSSPLHHRLLRLFDKRALPASVLLFFICLPGGAVSAFLALYAAATGVGDAGLYFACQALGTGFTRVFGGRLSDRHGEGPAVYVGGLCFFVGLILLSVAGSNWLFYAAAVSYGVGYGLTMPALQTMSLRTVPLQRRGAASSTYLSSFDVSFGLGGLLGGLLVDSVGYQYMLASMGISIIACMAIYYFWAAKTPSAHHMFQLNQQAAMQRARA